MISAASSLVPNYAADLRLDGKTFLVMTAGRGPGRQVAHALRQFGAAILCHDNDRAAASQVAFEVTGAVVAASSRPERMEAEDWLALVPPEASLQGVVDFIDAAADDFALRMRGAGRLCLEHGAEVLVLITAAGASNRFGDAVAELAQELFDDGIRVNAIASARSADTSAARIVPFLCSDLGKSLTGHVLLTSAPTMEPLA